jgi:hypothetical protein
MRYYVCGLYIQLQISEYFFRLFIVRYLFSLFVLQRVVIQHFYFSIKHMEILLHD